MLPAGLLLSLGLLQVSATPLPAAELAKRCVFDPQILTPNNGTVWAAGAEQNVTWDVSNLPNCTISNAASVVLFVCNGTITPAGPPDGTDIPTTAECSDREPPFVTLAQGFDLTTGFINVTVPANVTPGDSYQIDLFGDSGDLSNGFSIVAANETSSLGSDDGSDGNSGDDCEDDGSGGGDPGVVGRAALRENVWAYHMAA